MLPIRDDLVAELHQYLHQRAEVLAANDALDPAALFIRRDGSALTVRSASLALRCLLRASWVEAITRLRERRTI